MHILFPRICAHCRTPTPQLFCESCALFFEFLPPGPKRRAACFSHLEGVSTLVGSMRRKEAVALRQAAVSFLVIQFARLRWPLPDLVTSVPSRKLWIPNISETLARGFAHQMKLPFVKLTKRRFGELPHSKNPHFYLKKRVVAKRILIIDDYIESGKTMDALSMLLRKQMEAQVHGLALSQKRRR